MQLASQTRLRIAEFDARVDEAFDRLRGHPIADRVLYTASALGDYSLLWLILGGLRGLRSDHHLRSALKIGGLLAAESLLVNVGIKSFFGRTRPDRTPHPDRNVRVPRSSSFPSGHATSAFCAAVLLGDNDSLWPLYTTLAVIVAASRVHTKVHHASDVIAGIPVGLALGVLGRRFMPTASRHVGSR